MSKIAAIIGRILLALIFIVSGASKLTDVAGTEAMIVGVGLPSGLAIPAGLFELLAGLCLAAGFMVRLVSLLLAAFVALTILFYHNQFTDPMMRIAALKNLALIGGLLLAFAHSQMWSHYYSITRVRRGEIATRDVEERLHDAELRAARAEARADALVQGGAVTATPVVSGTTGHNVVTDVNDNGIPEVRRRNRWFDW
jgi:putative oxidoreductase